MKQNKIVSVSNIRWIILVMVLIVPFFSWSLYFYVGSPDWPMQMAKERKKDDKIDPSLDPLVAQMEEHLSKDPNDGRGWDVLAPIYLRLGQAHQAVNAYHHAIQFLGETEARILGLARALTLDSGGRITARVLALYEQAVELNPGNIEGWKILIRSYLALKRRDNALIALEMGIKKLEGTERDDLQAFAYRLGLKSLKQTP